VAAERATAGLQASIDDVNWSGMTSAERQSMVEDQLRARDIVDPRVLAAMQAVPRERFVPAELARFAYDDRPLAIGHGATISQPYIVALIAQLARIRSGDRVLDVGTGSGYQAAIAAQLGAIVLGIERVPELATAASSLLHELGYAIDVVCGDGWKGRAEHAPFDAILVAAAADEVPTALVDQLALGGRLVIPVGPPWAQQLRVVTRNELGTTQHDVASVSFVPLVRGD
jgi:protein-L-isoaspartate(D-aspartate) O-methyltransferase